MREGRREGWEGEDGKKGGVKLVIREVRERGGGRDGGRKKGEMMGGKGMILIDLLMLFLVDW